jgi:hypothetical protein
LHVRAEPVEVGILVDEVCDIGVFAPAVGSSFGYVTAKTTGVVAQTEVRVCRDIGKNGCNRSEVDLPTTETLMTDPATNHQAKLTL